jgi:GntR family transcriptional regulator / MocR family aminotransferase
MRRTRVSQTLELPIAPRPPEETKQAWVYRCLRDRILAGGLKQGDRLPASRVLAKSWGVSRGIVELAYEQLSLEGYVESRIGWGTEVIAGLCAGPRNEEHRHDKSGATDIISSANGSQVEPKRAESGVIETSATSARLVDTSLFTIRVWSRHLSSAMKSLTPALLAENDPKGYRPLRESISRYLRMTRGIQCDTSQIVITTGIRHAIDLVSKALHGNETAYYLEDPGYKTIVPLLRTVVNRIIYVPVDEEGFSVNDAKVHRRSGIAYVTPAHQAPLGMTMPVERRRQLLSWAKDCNVWIVEDDYDSEFSYGGSPLPALKAIDHDDRVIHCGSFNKSLFPSLRIGYMVIPDTILNDVVTVRSVTGRSNSIIEQLALTRYINDGDFARHLRASRDQYMRRRDLLLAELRKALGDKLKVTGEHAGFHFVLWLPAGCDEKQVVERLWCQGVYLEGLGEFARAVRMPPAIVVGYASLHHERILQTARAIADALAAANGTSLVSPEIAPQDTSLAKHSLPASYPSFDLG